LEAAYNVRFTHKYIILKGIREQNNFDKTGILIKTDNFFFFAKNILMKTPVRNEKTRCRVAGVEESVVLDFLFLL